MNELERIAGVEPVVDEDAVMDEVMAVVDGRPDRPLPEVAWSITTERAAEWAMRKLSDLSAAIDRYDLQIDRLKAERDRLAKALGWFDGHLQAWAISERTDAVKSIVVPSGRIATTKHKARIEVVDEQEVLDWISDRAIVHPELSDALKVELSVRLTELRKLLTIDDAVVGYVPVSPDGEPSGHVSLPPARHREGVIAAALRDLPDGWNVVRVETVRAAFFGDSIRPVPGTVVRDENVTAKVTPLSS